MNLIAALLLGVAGGDDAVHVYILAGQSNMEGKAKLELLEYQAGQPATRIVMMDQYQGQKPFGLRSIVAAKKDRPVFMLYLMHSYTRAASSTTETTISQCMWKVPRAPMLGRR